MISFYNYSNYGGVPWNCYEGKCGRAMLVTCTHSKPLVGKRLFHAAEADSGFALKSHLDYFVKETLMGLFIVLCVQNPHSQLSTQLWWIYNFILLSVFCLARERNTSCIWVLSPLSSVPLISKIGNSSTHDMERENWSPKYMVTKKKKNQLG